MKRIILISLAVISSIALFAKEPKRPDSYNYLRGIEAAEDGDIEKALSYLNREIEENPKNGYAFAWIASQRAKNNELGKSLNAINYAIKYLPKNDKYYCGWAYKMRAKIYLNLEDTIAALSDIAQAIKIDPCSTDNYEERADIYFNLDKYELADKDYLQMIKLEPGNLMGHMGHGRNLKEMKKYDEAISVFEYVIKMEPKYSSGYSFRGECYLYQEKYSEAISDFITALNLDYDMKAQYHLQHMSDTAFSLMMTKVKIEIAKNPNKHDWYYYSGNIYSAHKKYRSAIEMYKKASTLDHDVWYDAQIESCYEDLGDYANALKYAMYCYQSDSTNARVHAGIADLYTHMDSIPQAIKWISKAIELEPDYAYYHYRKGWIEDNAGMVDKAIEDYSTSIVIDPSYAYATLNRGQMYLKKGNKLLADADFRKTIELEPVPVDNACAMYAHLYLGDTLAATNFMDSVLAKFDGNEYDAACVYSLVGDTAKSLEYMRKAFENGFRRFPHAMHDDDLENLRQTQGFKLLYDEFWDKHQIELQKDIEEASISESVVYEIPFTNADGVTKVDCKINDLPLNFVFDTGASDVTLSLVEANFMFKNGYLDRRDIIGKEHYITADGSISEGTVFNLRTINFGGCTLSNVRASVVKSQRAPLLLGQSILQRLGKIEIDNENRIIKITSK